MKIFPLWVTLTLLLSCSHGSDKELAFALQMADSNSHELEKVLAHYQSDPLKQKAARYLIENMPYYFGYEGSELDSMKQSIADIIHAPQITPEDIYKRGLFRSNKFQQKYDIREIKAPYLIENIDFACKVWESRPWSKYYTFEDFCEYILPYRIGYEPLEAWRKPYYDKYSYILDSIYTGSDVVEACSQVAQQLQKDTFAYVDNIAFPIPNLGANFFLKNRIGSCKESCDFTLYVMRALGIPVATDRHYFYPGPYGVHYWNIVKDTTGQIVPFWFAEEARVKRGNNDKRTKRKVYRQCFKIQEAFAQGVRKDKEVLYPYRNYFLKDVTNEYFDTNDLKIRLTDKTDSKWVYLGGITPKGIFPVAIAEAGKALNFHQAEPDMIYQLMDIQDGYFKAIGNIFLFNGKSIQYMHADTTRWEHIALARKRDLNNRVQNHLNNIVGGRIEASHTANFKWADTLYQIDRCNYTMYNRVVLHTQKRYRYARYVSDSLKTAELAEIHFYADKELSQPIRYIPCQYDSLAFIPSNRNFNYIQDGDPLTFITSEEKGQFIAFDFQKPVAIQSLLYMPRNDDNFIRHGDNYELFYWDHNKWISLGAQTAAADTLYFKAPAKALLWLRNLTRGDEEAFFEYREGRQHFFP